MSSLNNSAELTAKDQNTETPTTTPQNTDTISSSSSKKKKSSKSQNFFNAINENSSNYEHHFEKWLENSSKLNFDSNVNDYSQQNHQFMPRHHLLQQDSRPPTFETPSISSFLNFNSTFKQQYPHLLTRQQTSSPINNNDAMSSLNTQQEFMSLPSLSKVPSTDNDVNNQIRRFSDLRIIEPNNSNNLDDDNEDDSLHTDSKPDKSQQNDGVVNNTELLVNLMKQVNMLHETNSKMFRNLHETKVEIEALKYAPSWGLKNRRDSLSGLSYLGNQSPAPTYHSTGSYNPGVVTDLIREVRDANRVRDESLLNRVKSIIDEKSWMSNESNLRILRELEEIKIQIHGIKLEKQSLNDRLTKLEEEVRGIKHIVGPSMYQPYPPYQPNTSLTINEQPSQMKRNQMNLNYGTLNTVNYPSENYQHASMPEEQNNFQKAKRSSLPVYSHSHSPATNNNKEENECDDNQLIQSEFETVQLRRHLQNVLTSKKQAEDRILALEKIVTKMSSEFQPHSHLHGSIHGSGNNGGTSEQHFNSNIGPLEQLIVSPVMGTNISSSSSSNKLLLSPKPQKSTTIQNVPGPVTDL